MKRLSIFLFCALISATSSQAANIYWVSFHADDNTPSAAAATAGFTNAPDAGYTQLLRTNGHTVTRVITSDTPDTALLNTADLVIISRSVGSGNYELDAETAAWNGITAPTMILGGYVLRNNRLGYTTGATIPDTAGPVRLTARVPSHPIFAGVSLDASNPMVNTYANIVSFTNTPQRGISVNTDPVAGGGVILGTIGTAGDPANGGMVIGEWMAGAVLATSPPDTLGGHRLVFLTGSREAAGLTAEGAGIYDLTADGAKLFLNAVKYMAAGPFIPSGVASAGLTNLVPDRIIFNTGTANLDNWEPNISVLGNSTFLIQANTFAADGALVNQRYALAFQPVAGGPNATGEVFFADNGNPFRDQINLSRQNGNPGRVAGDKRPGAANFIGGGEASLYGFPAAFNSDGRFNASAPFYTFLSAANGRDGCIQIHSLNTTTLAQAPRSKALDSAFGRLINSTPPAGASTDQISRFGGDLAGLDNGNFVSAVEDRSRLFNPNANAAVATIFRPDGSIVKDAFKVADGDLWSNLAAFRGGFCVRVAGTLYFFDNDGNPTSSTNQVGAGVNFDAGRGDGTRIAAHINSPYVFLAGNAATVAGDPLATRIAVFDSRARAFVAATNVSEIGLTNVAFDRVNIAADALDRVTVAYELALRFGDPPTPGQQQVVARVLAFNGNTKTFSYLTPSFYPFVNFDTAETALIRSQRPSVSMTTRQICIAAKGEINSTNNPAAGPDTLRQTTFYTVINHPDPQADPTPGIGGGGLVITNISVVGQAATLAWTGGTAPYLVQKKSSLTNTSWFNVLTTSNQNATVALQGDAGFFRVSDHAQTNVIALTAFLSGDAERPTTNASTAKGLGSFSLEGDTLNYYITFTGLSANASAAHIHGPTNTTAAASVIIPFSQPAATAGIISGSVILTNQQKAWVLGGLTYANIHDTPNFGGGEIRGQIGPTELKASLSGANEKPPVSPAGTGSATLTRIGNQLLFNITYSGLTSAANNAHIHGRTDVTDPAGVLVPLPTPTGTSGTLSGTLTLDNATLSAIVDGVSYINIHTANNPGGEIRGTITP